MEKIHLEQAKTWLYHAKEILGSDGNYSVGVAMTIPAIMKTNDALVFKFLWDLPKKHDEARILFLNLIKENKIDSKYSNYADIIQEAIKLKAFSEYRGKYFSKNDLENFIRKTDKFIRMVSTYVENIK